MNLGDTYQTGGMFDLMHNPIVTKVLEGEPERQWSQLRHRLAGCQTCCQWLREREIEIKRKSNIHKTLIKYSRNKKMFTKNRKLLVRLDWTLYESSAVDDRELLKCSYQCWVFVPVQSHSCHSWQAQPLSRCQRHTVTSGGCLEKKKKNQCRNVY